MITPHDLKDDALTALAIATTIYSLLPPWDWDAAFLKDFPRAQSLVLSFVHSRWYKLAIVVFQWCSGNLRTIVWRKSISMPVQIQKLQNGGT